MIGGGRIEDMRSCSGERKEDWIPWCWDKVLGGPGCEMSLIWWQSTLSMTSSRDLFRILKEESVAKRWRAGRGRRWLGFTTPPFYHYT